MKVVDFDGTVLDATFSVQPPENGVVSVVFESSGGHEGGPNPRNLQYRQGLNVLLRRLQLMNGVIREIRVETGRTRLLPVEQQVIVIPSRPFPVALSSVNDIDVFRQEISRFGRKVGQPPELAAEGGGSSRRLRIFLMGEPTDQMILERQLVGQGIEADAVAVAAVVEIAAGKSRGGGQGFLVSQAVRKAVEKYAVEWAIRHYRAQGWAVEDVGARESYDLRCTRGADERHVEVKGTTGLGETIILTRNEVLHALECHPNVDLFIVTEIRIEGRESDHPVPSCGVAHVCLNWCPVEADLTPVGYDYATGLSDLPSSASWMLVQ